MSDKSPEVPSQDRTALKLFYQTSDAYQHGLRERETDAFHHEFLRMVRTYIPPPSKLLDLGCGSGYSSLRLAESGYRVLGMDISEKFLDRAASRIGNQLQYTIGDALEMPFADQSFDGIASFDMIEHVVDAERVFREVDRTLRPGGRVVYVCPNYWSPIIPIKALINLLRGGPGYLSFYESIPAALLGILTTGLGTLKKMARSETQFIYRTPQLEGLTDADCDCVYLPSPVDFRRYFQQAGYRIVRYNREGSTPLRRTCSMILPSFTPTVYFVAEKPSNGSNGSNGL